MSTVARASEEDGAQPTVGESTSDEVREAQLLLQGYAESLQTDGVLGKETATALRSFQRDAGLAEDGVLGPQTLASLRQRLAAKRDQRLLDVRALPAVGLQRLGIRGEVILVSTPQGRIFEYWGFPPKATEISRFVGEYRPVDERGRFVLLAPAAGFSGRTALVVDDAWSVVHEVQADPSEIVRVSRAGKVAVGGDRVVTIRPQSGDTTMYGDAPDPIGLLWTDQEQLLIRTLQSLSLVRPDGTTRARVALHPEDARAEVYCDLAVSRDGRRVALAQRRFIFIHRGNDLSRAQKIGAKQQPSCMCFDHTGERLFIGMPSGQIASFDVSRDAALFGTALASWQAHSGNVIGLGLIDDGARLASLGGEGSLKIWSLDQPATAQRIAILKSDLDHGADALGLERDVRAFAQLILAKALSPPLSIGVFGDWGSGKSFFINELQRCISELKRRAQGAKERRLSCAWHGHVEQITFNAWHYAETNLWAALVTHLFDELARLVNPTEDVAQTRKRLLGDLETARAAKEEAIEQENAAQRELEKAQAEAKRVARELEEARTRAQQLDASVLLLQISNQLWDEHGGRDVAEVAMQWQKRVTALRSARGRWCEALRVLATAKNLLASILFALLAAALALYLAGLRLYEPATWKSLILLGSVVLYWLNRANELAGPRLDAALGWLDGSKAGGVIERWKRATDAAAKLELAPLSIERAEASAQVDNFERRSRTGATREPARRRRDCGGTARVGRR
ncbi:MAG: peptidoglycan-binding protein [Polyangiaceae bacterium]